MSFAQQMKAEQKRLEAENRKQREMFAKQFAAVMRHPNAVTVFREILGWCEVYHDGFDAGNPRVGDYTSGRRSIGLMLMERIFEVDPNLWLELHKGEDYGRGKQQHRQRRTDSDNGADDSDSDDDIDTDES